MQASASFEPIWIDDDLEYGSTFAFRCLKEGWQLIFVNEVGSQEVLANEEHSHARLVDSILNLSPPGLSRQNPRIVPHVEHAFSFQRFKMNAKSIEPFFVSVTSGPTLGSLEWLTYPTSVIDQPNGRLPVFLQSRSDFIDSTARRPGASGKKTVLNPRTPKRKATHGCAKFWWRTF